LLVAANARYAGRGECSKSLTTAVILILTLILVPLAAGLMLLCLRPDLPRKILVAGVTLAVCCGTVTLATLPTPIDLSGLPLNLHRINLGMLLVEIGMGIYIIYVGASAESLLDQPGHAVRRDRD
jgi:hypothetical protein